MKLTEAIVLFESFRDLKRIFRDKFVEVVGNDDVIGSALNPFIRDDPKAYAAYRSLAGKIGEARDKRTSIPSDSTLTADGLFVIIKWIAQHPVMETRPASARYKDTGTWIKSIKNIDGLAATFSIMRTLIDRIIEEESKPDKQKPKIITIKKTSDYEVYRLDNYAAARKVCTTFNTNFCIGSDPNWYKAYGEENNRETFAITLPNRTVVIVHAGTDGYLITSHDNKSAFERNAPGRGKGAMGVAEDFMLGKLDLDTALEALSTVISSKHMNEVKDRMTVSYDQAENSGVPIYSGHGIIVTIAYAATLGGDNVVLGVKVLNRKTSDHVYILNTQGTLMVAYDSDFRDAKRKTAELVVDELHQLIRMGSRGYSVVREAAEFMMLERGKVNEIGEAVLAEIDKRIFL